MNFTGSRQGFYEDDSSKGTVRPFSQSSSCSASPAASQQKGLVPLAYLHQHQRLGVGPWDETAFPCYSGSGGGGGANSQLDLMMNSSNSNVVDDVDESDEHHLLLSRAGGAGLDSSEGQEGGVRSSSGDGSGMLIEREHMFDKVVTPSDVGKLNRLVIPKQHAEKYFPLDSSTNEKGLLLNFEDRNGKPWRFRYSYWNSSQSYVMTKGWSRFVKEKKLDAGDIVSFQRGVGELAKDRLFIDWRRRPDAPDHHHHHYHHQLPPSIPALSLPHQFSFHHWNHPFYLQQQQQPRDHLELLQENAINSHQSHLNSSYGYGSVMTGNPCSGSIIYLRSATGGAAAAARPQHQVGVGVGMVQVQKGSSGVMRGTEEPMVFDSVPVVQGKAAAKRLRLFGVNMDCPISEEEDDTCGILSSTAVPHSTMASQPHYSSSSSSISPLQLRPYNGSPLLQMMPMSSNLLNKGKASMSLNLDI